MEKGNPAYILGYFRSGPGQSMKSEKLHYAYSRDGLHWYELNNNQAVWTAGIGEKILRDPFIGRGPDGTWHMVFTIRPRDWKAIGYARSKDLVTWTDERILHVMEGWDAFNCWAPEFSYDPDKGDFLVYWASSLGNDLSNSKHFAARTTDWEHFTKAELFFDPGFQTIDASLTEWNGSWYMAVKDESHVYDKVKNPNPPVNKLAVASRLEGPYEVVEGVRTPDYTEAPEFLKMEGQEKWYMLYDYWGHGRFGVKESSDLIHWSEELDDKLYRFPFQARHATVFPVREEELWNLIETYSLEARFPLKVNSPVKVAEAAPEGFMHHAFTKRTVCLWIQARSTQGIQILFDEGDDENGLAVRINGGRLEAAVASGGRRLVISDEGPAIENLSLVSIVFCEGELSLYLNHELVASGNASFDLVGTHSGAGGYGGRFGSDAFGDAADQAPFDGTIRTVRVYSLPLQAADVGYLFKKGI